MTTTLYPSNRQLLTDFNDSTFKYDSNKILLQFSLDGVSCGPSDVATFRINCIQLPGVAVTANLYEDHVAAAWTETTGVGTLDAIALGTLIEAKPVSALGWMDFVISNQLRAAIAAGAARLNAILTRSSYTSSDTAVDYSSGDTYFALGTGDNTNQANFAGATTTNKPRIIIEEVAPSGSFAFFAGKVTA